MKKIFIILFVLCALPVVLFAADSTSHKSVKPSSRKAIKKQIIKKDTVTSLPVALWDTTLCFPLSLDKQYKVYDYVIYLDDERVIKRYKPFFDKNEYKFSGYVWEALIRDMLNDADKELTNNVVLRSERNAVMINITKYQSIKKFPDYMCKIFSNLTKVNEYLKKANRAQMPDY